MVCLVFHKIPVQIEQSRASGGVVVGADAGGNAVVVGGEEDVLVRLIGAFDDGVQVLGGEFLIVLQDFALHLRGAPADHLDGIGAADSQPRLDADFPELHTKP